jgi:hypothetical protein
MSHDSDSDIDEVPRRRPETSFTQLMKDVPARESIPDSCSEGSDSDDDAILQPLPISRPSGEAKMPSWMAGISSGRNSPVPPAPTTAKAKTVLAPKKMNHVQTTEGYGGRLVYAVTNESGPANYYCVQW